MRKDYEKLFTHLKPKEPPVGLLGRIMLRIDEEERLMSIKRRLVLFSSSFVVSAIAFIPVIGTIRAEFAQSEFYQFFSLLFSDGGLVMQYWQDFSLALLESVPVISIVMLLGTSLVFLWSLKHLARAAKVVFNQPQLINS